MCANQASYVCTQVGMGDDVQRRGGTRWCSFLEQADQSTSRGNYIHRCNAVRISSFWNTGFQPCCVFRRRQSHMPLTTASKSTHQTSRRFAPSSTTKSETRGRPPHHDGHHSRSILRHIVGVDGANRHRASSQRANNGQLAVPLTHADLLHGTVHHGDLGCWHANGHVPRHGGHGAGSVDDLPATGTKQTDAVTGHEALGRGGAKATLSMKRAEDLLRQDLVTSTGLVRRDTSRKKTWPLTVNENVEAMLGRDAALTQGVISNPTRGLEDGRRCMGQSALR